MSEPMCPTCGNTDALQAWPSEDDIQVTCQRCGSTWIRGEPRCKRCGRAGGLSAPQRTTRKAGLAAVGSIRHVLLCSSCDREAIGDMFERNQPVPERYVSRFLFGEVVDHPTGTGPASERRAAQSPQTAEPEPTKVATRHPAPPAEAPTTLADPTVRQAIEAFLDTDPLGVEIMVLVLLGARLGSSKRLSGLNAKELADVLTTWVDHTWAPQTSQRAASTATVRSAFAYWRGKGWLQSDPSEGLR
jgi:hypothetical protein